MNTNPLILITNGYTVGMKDMVSVYDWANKLSFDSPEYRAATVVDIKSGLVFGELETGVCTSRRLSANGTNPTGPASLPGSFASIAGI